MSTPNSLNIALLGLGRAGQFQLNSIRAIPNVTLKHAVDVDEERARIVAAEFVCSHSAAPDAALADPDVNAVIVATPTAEHFGQITAALDAGKPVFTEKPLGNGLDEIDTCFQRASDTGLPLFVGFNRRFDPTFSSVARRVQAGDIGAPQMLRVTSRDSPLPGVDYLRTSHGIFHDCIVHDLDMIRFITRENPVEIYSIGSNFISEIQALDDLDNVMVILKFASGILASIDVNRFSAYGYDQRIEAFGNKGMLQAENRSPESTVIATGEGFQRPPIEYSFPTRHREAYRLELEAFAECVLDGEPLPITHEDVRMSFILCELAERSYREGKPLKLSLDEFA
jgi:myo-inositol 2-dehydrogenase/D-chiro-inositol 1-dehydrogenase